MGQRNTYVAAPSSMTQALTMLAGSGKTVMMYVLFLFRIERSIYKGLKANQHLKAHLPYRRLNKPRIQPMVRKEMIAFQELVF